MTQHVKLKTDIYYLFYINIWQKKCTVLSHVAWRYIKWNNNTPMNTHIDINFKTWNLSCTEHIHNDNQGDLVSTGNVHKSMTPVCTALCSMVLQLRHMFPGLPIFYQPARQTEVQRPSKHDRHFIISLNCNGFAHDITHVIHHLSKITKNEAFSVFNNKQQLHWVPNICVVTTKSKSLNLNADWVKI